MEHNNTPRRHDAPKLSFTKTRIDWSAGCSCGWSDAATGNKRDAEQRWRKHRKQAIAKGRREVLGALG
jgi:hypothetical protein